MFKLLKGNLCVEKLLLTQGCITGTVVELVKFHVLLVRAVDCAHVRHTAYYLACTKLCKCEGTKDSCCN